MIFISENVAVLRVELLRCFREVHSLHGIEVLPVDHRLVGRVDAMNDMGRLDATLMIISVRLRNL